MIPFTRIISVVLIGLYGPKVMDIMSPSLKQFQKAIRRL